MEDRIRVFVYAGDPISEAGIAGQLRGQPSVHVVAEADVDAAQVAIVVTDEVDEESQRAIKALQRNGVPRVLVVVTRVDDAGLLATLEAGACGLLRRAEARPDRLVAAVRAAAAGDGTMPPDLLGRLLDQVGRLQRQVLSPRGLTLAGTGRARDRGPAAHRRRAGHQRDRPPALLLAADGEERHPRRHLPAPVAQPVARGGLRHAPGAHLMTPDLMTQVATAQDIDELDRQVQRGSQFTLAILHRSAQRLGRAEAILGGVLDVLQAKGLVTTDDLDAALAADAALADDDVLADGGLAADDDSDDGRPAGGVDDEPPSAPVVGWPSVALRADPDPSPEPAAASAAAGPAVDCASRLAVCQAVCCRLRFTLSAEEVDGGAVRWDIGHPYVIRHDARGTCVHNDPATSACSVYADRPQVCRRYDCTLDGRIWKDFDGMVLNEEWITENLGPRDITVAAVVPAMMPTPVTISPRPPS